MASLELRNQSYRIVFRFQNRKFSFSANTSDRQTAQALFGGIKKTEMLVEQGLLTIPDDGDVVEFFKSGGLNGIPKKKIEIVTLANLRDQFLENRSTGVIEKNSLDMLKIHCRHLTRYFGEKFEIARINHAELQKYVDHRLKKKIGSRKLSPLTARKEIITFKAIWTFGVTRGFINGNFPSRGLTYPKIDAKPPFMTLSEVERKIELGGLSSTEKIALFESLYLRREEIDDLLEFVKTNALQTWIYPVIATAALTGARRSELVRIDITDVDFERNILLIREKKRSKKQRTTRHVSMTTKLSSILNEWLSTHPGGRFLFANKIGSTVTEVSKSDVYKQFKRTLKNSRWKVIRGLHTLRHSFISCLAAAGIDQRIIDEFVGHSTEEQRQRYRHLLPDVKQKAISEAFG